MELIIFDFDGTIADSFGIFIEATNCLAEDFGYSKLSSLQIEFFRQLSLREMVQEFDLPKWKLPFFLRRFRKELERLTSELQIVSGMREVLLELEKGDGHLGIVTSNSRKNVESFLSAQGINHLFDFIYAGQVLSGKAKTLRRIVRRHQIDPKKVIFIGDEVGDIDAANKVGILSAAVSWGFNDKLVLEKCTPNVLADQPYQLASAIAQYKTS